MQFSYFSPPKSKTKNAGYFWVFGWPPEFFGLQFIFPLPFFPHLFLASAWPEIFFQGISNFFSVSFNWKKCEWKRKMSKEITRRALHVPGPWDPRNERREESLFSFKGKCHLQVHSKPAKHTLFSLNTSILNKYPLLSSGL